MPIWFHLSLVLFSLACLINNLIDIRKDIVKSLDSCMLEFRFKTFSVTGRKSYYATWVQLEFWNWVKMLNVSFHSREMLPGLNWWSLISLESMVNITSLKIDAWQYLHIYILDETTLKNYQVTWWSWTWGWNVLNFKRLMYLLIWKEEWRRTETW